VVPGAAVVAGAEVEVAGAIVEVDEVAGACEVVLAVVAGLAGVVLAVVADPCEVVGEGEPDWTHWG